MRGNRLARNGDPMKTRSQRRKERRERISRTNRAQREKRRVERLDARKSAREVGDHMSAIMESYARRRKSERDAERAAQRQKEEEEMQKSAQEKEGGNASGRIVGSPSQRPPVRGLPPRDKKMVVKRSQPKVITRSLY